MRWCVGRQAEVDRAVEADTGKCALADIFLPYRAAFASPDLFDRPVAGIDELDKPVFTSKADTSETLAELKSI